MPRFKLASLFLLVSYVSIVVAATSQLVSTKNAYNLWVVTPLIGHALLMPLLLWHGAKLYLVASRDRAFHFGFVFFAIGGLSSIHLGIPATLKL